MIKANTVTYFMMILVAAVGVAEPVANAPDWLAYPEGLPAVADPLRFTIEHARAPLADRNVPATSEVWAERAPRLKAILAASLGLDPMPPRTPLNAQVTGKAERDTYFIENIVYESQPGFYVTANLYIPKGVALPAPAVVVGAGHAMEHGKNHDLYQLGQLGLVKQGLIVMAFDPIGQGERNRPGFAHELGYGSLLVGRTNEGMIVWDALRAVDYLVTRKEVDASHIGLTGNSGGGELVFYAMPFDERIQAGASFSFVCSYDLWLAEGGNHCICNHMPGLATHMEQFEIIGLNAPRAFLAGNGTEDTIFPIAGVRETMKRASEIYVLKDAPDRIAAAEAPMPHGWSQPLREAGTGWLARWLQGVGEGSPIPEVGVVAEDPVSPDIRCFKDGKMPEGAETIVTLNQKRAEEQIARYSAPPASAADWDAKAPELRRTIWGVLGGEPAAFVPSARVVKTFVWEGLHVEVLSISVEEDMEIGAVYTQPEHVAPEQAATLFVGQHEAKALAIQSGYAAETARKGPVLVIDPRGTGESLKHLNHLTSDGIVLGRPLFAQQVWDVLQAARWLSTRGEGNPQPVALRGLGDGALLAVYAAALEGSFNRVEVGDMLASYRYFLEDEQPQSITLCVPNILNVADIAQVLALAAPTPVTLTGAIGFGEAALPQDAALRDLAYARAAYAAGGAAENLQIK